MILTVGVASITCFLAENSINQIYNCGFNRSEMIKYICWSLPDLSLRRKLVLNVMVLICFCWDCRCYSATESKIQTRCSLWVCLEGSISRKQWCVMPRGVRGCWRPLSAAVNTDIQLVGNYGFVVNPAVCHAQPGWTMAWEDTKHSCPNWTPPCYTGKRLLWSLYNYWIISLSM